MNKIKNQLPIFFIFITILYSCSSSTHKTSNKNTDQNTVTYKQFDSTLSKGKLIEKVVCRDDTTQSYALYLPSFYSSEKKWPVIYFFDPHADGSLPVNKYKALAQKYAYIIIGSNNSKNGLPMETLNRIADILINDAQQRLSIDENRVFTGGFSGGSRVASSVAIYKGGIAGVIGCAAGFPNINGPLQHTFHYIGIAGNEDFNLNEMKELDKALDGSGLRHDLIIYNGKHQWAPEEIMLQAFTWLEVNSMKDKTEAVKDTFINNMVVTYEDQIKELEQEEKVNEACIAYNHLIKYFEGMKDVSGYKKAVEGIERSDKMKEIIRTRKEIEDLESKKQKEYMYNVSSKNIDWWKKEVTYLNKPMKNKQEETSMNKRLLGFLSLTMYMYSDAALKENKYVEAEHFLTLYRLVDPMNVDAFYLSACLSAKQKDSMHAITYLGQAIKMGFTDKKKLQEDTSFDFIKETQEYKKLSSLY